MTVQYIALLKKIVEAGNAHPDRTGVGRVSIFGTQMRYDLSKGEFPLLTTKKVFMRGLFEEMMWFLRGQTDNKILKEKNVHIWDNWEVREEDISKLYNRLKSVYKEISTTEEQHKASCIDSVGTLGGIYGRAWRNLSANGSTFSFTLTGRQMYDKLLSDNQAKVRAMLADNPVVTTIDTVEDNVLRDIITSTKMKSYDQLEEVIYSLKTKPFSARHVISSWIPEILPNEDLSPQENAVATKAALSPCHCLFQFFVSNPVEEGGKKRLSLQLYQRSADAPVGVPLNQAQYALLLMMVAQVCDYDPFEFIWTGGDTHYYFNQIDGIKEQLTRVPKTSPTVKLNPEVKDILAFEWSDVTIENYDPDPVIVYPVAI